MDSACVERRIAEAAQTLGVAGMAVAIVGPGAFSLTTGDGCADVRTGARANAATLFRIGSTSKLVTATAAMQLVESGRLSLDADVDEYLEPELRMPEAFVTPVTLRNLLTHTAGFEENQLGCLVKRNAAELVPLARHLAAHRPGQVRAPTIDFRDGRGAAYSNWGMALAGHIVARRAQMPFDDYVERHVFQPLGMTRSTFREPVPSAMAGRLARGYRRDAGGQLVEHGFEFFHCVGPAGSMSTTAADMLRFLRAHLGIGPAVLGREAVRLMQSRVLDPHPAVNGAGLGFYEMTLRGRRAVGHQGATICFASELALLPDEGVGVFVAVNTRISPRRLHAFVGTLVDALLPQRSALRTESRSTPLSRYAGTYLATPHSHRTPDKFLLLAVPAYETKVTISARDTLQISNLAGRREWFEIAPAVFQQKGSGEVVAFVDDVRGHVSHLLGPAPFAPAYRVGPSRTPAFHRALIAHAATGFHLALAWHATAGAHPAVNVAATIAALNLAGLSLVRQSFAEGGIGLVHGYPDAFRDGLRLLACASELTGAMVRMTVRAWIHEQWTQGDRQGLAAFAALALAFLGCLRAWNLVGTR